MNLKNVFLFSLINLNWSMYTAQSSTFWSQLHLEQKRWSVNHFSSVTEILTFKVREKHADAASGVSATTTQMSITQVL